ncbi:YqzE family protein [Salibacterium aidingense]|uniref:YqzE family protein n=1 Tax=Salibacterium aidingense TaxID=384933 RepID=UPI000403F61D|nr:YqzE family protein [Salibacterium aidingense]
MKPNPFLKFITKEMVEALDERMNKKKRKRKNFRSLFNLKHSGFRWFGMLPFSFKIAWQKRKRIKS